MEQERPINQWHLDKRVNLSIIGGLIAQALVFGAMYGRLETRVTALEAQAQMTTAMPERMGRIEERIIGLKETLDRIERRLPEPKR